MVVVVLTGILLHKKQLREALDTCHRRQHCVRETDPQSIIRQSGILHLDDIPFHDFE